MSKMLILFSLTPFLNSFAKPGKMPQKKPANFSR